MFNYYPADYTLAGGNIPAPEFGIYTSAEFLNRANQVNDLLYNVDQSWSQQGPLYGWGPIAYVPGAVGTPSPPLSAFLADAANPDVLVERLNRLLPARHDDARRAQDHRQRRVQARCRQSAAPGEDGASTSCSSRSTIRCRNERST